MYRRILGGVLLLSSFLTSCKTKYDYNPEGMQKLDAVLSKQFGKDAWYTDIVIRSLGPDENAVTVTETDDPNALKQEQWLKQGDSWEKMGDVALHIENGKPEDYMFQLDGAINLPFLGKLMEQSQQKLARELNVRDAEIVYASIQSARNVVNRRERFLYTVSLHSPAAGKSYSLVYDTSGNLVSFNR